MICAIDRMLECSADERVLIVLCVMGLEQSMIAEFLRISRFSLRRRFEALRKRRNFDFVAATETAGDLSPLLVCFAEVCEAEEAYIAFVARRLAGLSEKELGMLFGFSMVCGVPDQTRDWLCSFSAIGLSQDISCGKL